ncbi:MAG: helix-turn-helix domain-containing protein, partial [Bryobacteraceae bacterium]
MTEALAAGLHTSRPGALNPGDSELQALENLMSRAYRDPGAFPCVESLAEACGVGASRLILLFLQDAHTTPDVFLNRARVKAAHRLLLETRSSVAGIACEIGFQSASAFQDYFRRQNAFGPNDYRRMLRSREFTLQLPDDFYAAEVLRYHGRDPSSVSERVNGSVLAKVLLIEDKAVEVRVELEASRAHCTVSASLAPEGMAAVHRSVLRILGLTQEARPSLAQRLSGPFGLRIPLTANVFEALVWAIVGQQINLRFAATLRRGLIRLAGKKSASGLHAHPDPRAVALLDTRDLA